MLSKKKKIFLLPIFPLLFFSLEGILGIIFGFFVARTFAPKLPSLIFTFKDFKIHFHHWFLGSLFLIFSLSLNLFSTFYNGFLGGIILEGIYNYSDWYKIIKKTPPKR